MKDNNQPLKYEFNGFQLDPGRRQLYSPDGKSINLTSRVFDTLLYLVAHRGELLDKGTLMQAVWPDTVVEENNLNQAISTLRKALGETPGAYQFILTEPGRGYRFVAEVQTLAHESAPISEVKQQEFTPPPRSRPGSPVLLGLMLGVLVLIFGYIYMHPPGAPPAPQSLAVLPFVDMSPDQEQEYFVDGVAEEVLNQLSRIHGLYVAGRTSSFYFKGKNEDFKVIGEKLSVAHILEGSVRKDGNHVRITVQLVDVNDGYQLWSKSYDRTLENIFAIQEDIARSVAEALEITLGLGELGSIKGMTRNVVAYEDYLTGRSLSRYEERQSYLHAIEHLERSVFLDPEFGLAWGELAYVYYTAAIFGIPDRAEEYLEKSEQAATRAIILVPGSVSSLNAIALLQIHRREWAAAEDTFKQALTLAPADYTINSSYGLFLDYMGRPRDAIEYLERAGKAEPLNVIPAQNIALSYELMGEYNRALQGYEQAKWQKVGNLAFLDSAKLVLALAVDDRKLIETLFEKTIEADSLLLPPANRMITPTMRSLLDDPEAAREALRHFAGDPAFNNSFARNILSIWACYFGDDELALDLQYQGNEPSVILATILWRPVHKSMRQLPGFKALLRDLGLVDYWRATGNWGEFCRPVGNDDFVCN